MSETARHGVWAWIEAWTHGWRDHDPETVASRYAQGAQFVSHPFRDPESPLEYARKAFAAEDEVEFWFAAPRFFADDAAVEYWAIIGHGGRQTTIAGTSLLRFDEAGYVVEHRDYWSSTEGAVELPGQWHPIVAHARRQGG